MLSIGTSAVFWGNWQRRAGWAKAGSALHLLDGKLSLNGLVVPFTDSCVGFERATNGWALDASGVPQQFNTGEVRATNAGVYTEQSSEGLFTAPENVNLWANCGATSSLTGEEPGPFKIARVATSGATEHRKQSNVIHALAGEKYALSVYFRFGPSGALLVMAHASDGAGGSAYSSLIVTIDEKITNAAVDQETSFSNPVLEQVGLLYRLTAVLNVEHDGPLYVGPGPNSADAGDYVDIAGCQLEAGEVASSFIPGGGVRDADNLSFDLSGSDFSHGVYGVWRGVVFGQNADYDFLLSLSNADATSRYQLHSTPTGNAYAALSNEGVSSGSITRGDWGSMTEVVFGVGPNFHQIINNGNVSSINEGGVFDASYLDFLSLGIRLDGVNSASIRTDELRIIAAPSSGLSTGLLQSQMSA